MFEGLWSGGETERLRVGYIELYSCSVKAPLASDPGRDRRPRAGSMAGSEELILPPGCKDAKLALLFVSVLGEFMQGERDRIHPRLHTAALA